MLNKKQIILFTSIFLVIFVFNLLSLILMFRDEQGWLKIILFLSLIGPLINSFFTWKGKFEESNIAILAFIGMAVVSLILFFYTREWFLLKNYNSLTKGYKTLSIAIAILFFSGFILTIKMELFKLITRKNK